MDDENIICGLAYRCPYNDRLGTCSLFYMEGKSFTEKLVLVEEMDEQGKAEILQQHANCKNKLNGYEKW